MGECIILPDYIFKYVHLSLGVSILNGMGKYDGDYRLMILRYKNKISI